MTDSSPFRFFPDPDLPGWHRWALVERDRYNDMLGPISVRADGPKAARIRMTPARAHSNLRDQVHGGALLGFIDMALFGAGRALGIDRIDGASTVDLSAQFIDGAQIGIAIEAEIELLRETGRLFFMQGRVVQDGRIIAAFAGTARKGGTPAPASGPSA